MAEISHQPSVVSENTLLGAFFHAVTCHGISDGSRTFHYMVLIHLSGNLGGYQNLGGLKCLPSKPDSLSVVLQTHR